MDKKVALTVGLGTAAALVVLVLMRSKVQSPSPTPLGAMRSATSEKPDPPTDKSADTGVPVAEAAANPDLEMVKQEMLVAQQRTAAVKQLLQMRAMLDAVAAKEAGVLDDPNFAEIRRNLNTIKDARAKFIAQSGNPPESFGQLLAVETDGLLRNFKSIEGEDYSKLPMSPTAPWVFSTASGTTGAVNASGTKTPAEQRYADGAIEILPAFTRAVAAFHAARGDRPEPASAADILPFFSSPDETSSFLEVMGAWREMNAGR